MDVVKRYLLIALFLISGCSKKELESVNETSLIEKNGVYYTKDKQPYSGQVSSLYENGSIKSEWTLKNGRLDGLYNLWYKSGKKWFQKNYKDGELDGLSIFWDREEFLDTEKTYKDGELILQRCFDVDGNECECSDLGRGCK
ncbi:uncharacterized protein METZ01_LOCUS134213 [marine metagenome]|uniref:Toxin-antitoxin system YwqK family antitoxin n=1 Tax=marine metagenome TaxID=408172 RepID=A0A381YWN1_9ZZZZ